MDDNHYKQLCLFTLLGATYTFKDVEVRSDNETAITFIYTAMSDGETKRGVFYKRNLCGCSFTK